MRHLHPQLPRRPPHRVFNLVVFRDVTPGAVPTLRTEKFFQPLMTQNQHGIGVDDQSCLFLWHATSAELIRRQQMEKILLSIAVDQLPWMGRAEKLTSPDAATAAHRMTSDQASRPLPLKSNRILTRRRGRSKVPPDQTSGQRTITNERKPSAKINTQKKQSGQRHCQRFYKAWRHTHSSP